VAAGPVVVLLDGGRVTGALRVVAPQRAPALVAALLVPSAEQAGAAVAIHPVVIDVHLPAGVAGPDPMDFDVRCFLVAHAGFASSIRACPDRRPRLPRS
jgi:hypothetical protein